MIFSKSYDLTLDDSDGRLILTNVDSVGEDLDDLLSNAQISLTTWHGNEGPEWSLGDMPTKIYDQVEQDFIEALAYARERKMEENQ